MVYRRDSIDRLHTGTAHQLDLWRVTSRPAQMSHADPPRENKVAVVTQGNPMMHHG